MQELKRSSAAWAVLTGVIVVDPDGWDRRNYEQSWNEPITLEEFRKRTFMSTVFLSSIPPEWM
jgi:hypothetical protein